MTADLLETVGARLRSDEPLTDAQLEQLSGSRNILVVGMLADDVRRRRHGSRTTFVRVEDVAWDDPAPAWPAATGEIRLTGAPTPWPDALAAVSRVVRASGSVPVTGFSLADLEELAGRQGRILSAILEDLRAAGLEWIAEAPIDRLRDASAAFAALGTAGMRLARCTVTSVAPDGGLDGFRFVRRLIADGAQIRAFAPLARTLPAEPSTGYDDVKGVALARLAIDNVPSIQVDWRLYGPKLAQVALNFGADDIDAVPARDDGSLGRRRQALEEIRRNITAAMQTPVERTGRFDLVDR